MQDRYNQLQRKLCLSNVLACVAKPHLKHMTIGTGDVQELNADHMVALKEARNHQIGVRNTAQSDCAEKW